MYISKAHKQDLPAIKYLLEKSGKFTFLDSCINKRDLAYQVRTEEGKLIGFVWCGIMGGGKVGYIDHLCVDKEHPNKSIAKDMGVHLLRELLARKVKYIIGFSANDEHQIKLLKGLGKMSPSLPDIRANPGVLIEWTHKE